MNIHAIQTGTVALTTSWRDDFGTAARLGARQPVRVRRAAVAA
jgi:hypothetical protein